MNETVIVISSSILQLIMKCKIYASTMKQHELFTTMHEMCLKLTSDVNYAIKNMFRRNKHVSLKYVRLIMFWL